MRTLLRLLSKIPLRRSLNWLLLLFWALWFGASIATVVFVTHFFSSLPRDSAADAASSMFHSFGNYGLVLAAVMILITGMMSVVSPSKGSLLMLGGLTLAGGMSVAFSLGLIPRMEQLRHEGQSQTAEFQSLHKKSSRLIAMQTFLLLGLGVGGAVIIESQKKAAALQAQETSDETVQV